VSLGRTLETAKVSPQKVRAILRKAGYPASKTRTTRIRGWHNWSAGSEVKVRGEAIVIEWTFGSTFIRDDNAKRDQRQKIEAMRQALLDAGIVAALETDDWGAVKLTVSQ
jgi:ABC-type transport system substrate-binding protein